MNIHRSVIQPLAHPLYDGLAFALAQFGHDLRYSSGSQVARQARYDALLYGFAGWAAITEHQFIHWRGYKRRIGGNKIEAIGCADRLEQVPCGNFQVSRA